LTLKIKENRQKRALVRKNGESPRDHMGIKSRSAGFPYTVVFLEEAGSVVGN